MERYKEKISELVQVIVEVDFGRYNWRNVEEKFQIWKNARSKEDVKHFFNDFFFGVCYARKLYNSRVDCFHEVLKQFLQFPKVLQIMKKSKTVISFGCGPGPEIAAYVSFLRNDLNCLDLLLNVLAMDQLSYWQQFIDAVSYLDRSTTITFVNQTITFEYLRHITRSDVCIMSYPHAVDFDDIWELLKIKFSLIIVIDQPKTRLLDNVRQCGYRVVNFVYKKNKTCFFYFDPNGNENHSSLSSSSSSSHRITTQMVPNCIQNALIERQLSCGHTIIVKRSEYGKSVLCEKIVEKKCPRNVHVKLTVCGHPFICEELCEKILSCNHSVFMKCSQMETDLVIFQTIVNHQLVCDNVTTKRPFQVQNLNIPDITSDRNVMQKIKKKKKRNRKRKII